VHVHLLRFQEGRRVIPARRKGAKPRLPWACWAALLLTAFPAWGTITVSAWSPLYRGIELATGTADTNETRLQKVFTLRVDLSDPTIEFFSTPATPNGTNETLGQTTTDFVQTYRVAAGVNANFFTPVTAIPNDPRNLRGLAISQGTLVSPHENSYPPALVTRSNQVTFTTSPPGDLSSFWTAVAGSDLILINGAPQLQSCTTTFCLENPRTALGLSQDGRYFYLMVIDGRQASWSMGATLYETGQWLARFGAWNGLNLDGGGSTAMARLTNGTAVLFNKPSEGTQRVDGNHLGVFAQPLQPVVWNGGGANNYWNNAANWGGTLPTPYSACDVQFAGTVRRTPSNNFPANSTFRHITFNAGAGAFTLGGNSITLNGGITNNSASLQTLSLPITTTAVHTLTAASGSITLGSNISGAGGLTLVGPGTVTLSGSNIFTGAITVSGGTLAMAGSLTNTAGPVTVDGGILATSGAINTGTGAWAAGGTAGSKGMININAGSDIRLAGTFDAGNNVSGSGAVTITGGGLTNTQASGAANFRVGYAGYGALNMSGGNVKVNTFYVDGGVGTGVALISGGALYCGTGADYLLVGNSTGTGVLTVNGGLLNHAGANRTISVNNSGDARGELNLLSGAIDNSGGGVSYGYNTGTGNGAGIVNLNGGTLTLNRFINTKQGGATTGTGIACLNLNGGTLTASPSTLSSPSQAFSSNFIPARILVCINGAFGAFAGGAVIDTAGQNCLVEPALLAPTGNGISALAVANGGAGYIGAPYVSVSGTGSNATAIANMVDDGTGKGTFKVGSITVCNPGAGYAGTPVFSFKGGAPTTAATPGAVSTAPNTSGGLTKNGAGMLTLLGTNTYAGATIVNGGSLIVNGSLSAGSAVTVLGGALGGTGVIGGPVSVQLGGTLAPGASIGTLSLSNTLTLQAGSTTFMEINGAAVTSDQVRGVTTVHYGGTLVVSNTAGTLTAGQTFQLFSSAGHTDTFANITSALGNGLKGQFNPTNGVLTVAPDAPTTATNISVAFSGNTLTLTWPGSYLGWYAQSNSVSIADPLYWFDIPGSQTTTNLSLPANPAMTNVFYRLRYPVP
jgi:autotransporter-associated beta strand protein